jgi:hypothetical protein
MCPEVGGNDMGEGPPSWFESFGQGVTSFLWKQQDNEVWKKSARSRVSVLDDTVAF